MRLNQRITEAIHVLLVQEEINVREAELQSLMESISDQKEKVAISAASVSQLNLGIDSGRIFIENLESTLKGLEELKKGLSNDGAGTGASYLLYDVESIGVQITNKHKELQEINTKVEVLEKEIYVKRFLHDVAVTHIANLENSIEPLVHTIQKLKSAFSPFWEIPSEVLVEIFRIRVEDDFDEYVQDPGTGSYLSTVLVLSHVCLNWRHIIQAERSLWRYFVCTASQLTRVSHRKLWERAISTAHRSMHLAINLHNSPLAAQSPSLDAHADLLSHLHSLHLLFNGNSISSIETIPATIKTSLVLHLKQVPTTEFFENINKRFSLVTDLTIICSEKLPYLSPTFHLRTSSPVAKLKIDLTTFGAIGIGRYGNISTLQRLDFRHNGVNCLPQYPPFQCRNLEILGITPPDIAWLGTAEIPRLKQLILYGPKSRTINLPSLIPLSLHPDFHRVRELDLHKWPQYKSLDGSSWSITTVLIELLDKLRMLKILRCVDSFIEGDCLVTLVQLLKNTESGLPPSGLTTVVVDCCTGISQDNCEHLEMSVNRLVVHV